ncbi:unnamed protein product [Nesidiocoris tenuis]|uniref:Uncharacterized protein n=1 Tax=Nesidiocoris tenuis TaxID=355587 RepID=A0A6H5GIW9_9HEMI|nr:unnamed protein product [Nesidiocoris tenuis]
MDFFKGAIEPSGPIDWAAQPAAANSHDHGAALLCGTQPPRRISRPGKCGLANQRRERRQRVKKHVKKFLNQAQNDLLRE